MLVWGNIMTLCVLYFSVVGRCVPAIFADIKNAADDTLKDDGGQTVYDKFGNAVNGTFLEDATKYDNLIVLSKCSCGKLDFLILNTCACIRIKSGSLEIKC